MDRAGASGEQSRMKITQRTHAFVGVATAMAVTAVASGWAFAQNSVDDLPPIDAFPPIQSQELDPPRPPEGLPFPGEEALPAQAEPDWLLPAPSEQELPPPEQSVEPLPPVQGHPEQSVEEIVPEEEKKVERVSNPVAEFAGLDKITGRITSFDVYINETVQFGALQVTPKVCYSRPDAEEPKTDSFVEVDEITLDRKIRRIFTGWMFAESPGISAVEHAVYDVWLKTCKQKSDVPPPEQANTN